MDAKPLVVIVGPTASGKSELALKIAEHFNGEIICADSRTVYKGMDIGTAKPTKTDQKRVKHYLLDVVEPGQAFNAHAFKSLAEAAIVSIRHKNKLPIVVGGTGLYIDSLIFDYQFPSLAIPEIREQLNSMNLDELYDYCGKNFITLPSNYRNKRHVITAITHHTQPPRGAVKSIDNTIIVGIATNNDILRQRIANRAEYIFSHGVVEEAKKLGEIYGWDNESMTANIYPITRDLIENKVTLEAAKAIFITRDLQLAKRQLTWLKRNPFIKWHTLIDAEKFLFTTLAKVEQK